MSHEACVVLVVLWMVLDTLVAGGIRHRYGSPAHLYYEVLSCGFNVVLFTYIALVSSGVWTALAVVYIVTQVFTFGYAANKLKEQQEQEAAGWAATEWKEFSHGDADR